MKKIIFLFLIILSSCKDDEDSHFCNFNNSENAPNIVGIWDLERDYRAYRLTNDELAFWFTEPIRGVYEFCENGYGIYKFEHQNEDKEGDVTWSYFETDKIVIHTTVHEPNDTYYYRDTLEILEDREDYQFLTDTVISYHHAVSDTLRGISTWKLRRK